MITTIELKPCKALKSPDEVKAEVKRRLPELYKAAKITVEQADPKHHPWVWLKLPAKPPAEARAVLGSGAYDPITKETDGTGIGFHWGGGRKAWYHTCETPPEKLRGRRFRRRPSSRSAPPPKKEEEAPARPRAGKLPAVDSDTFRKLFQ